MRKAFNVSNYVIEQVINEWVQGELNRNIMKCRHIDLLCYEKIAERLEASDSTVKRVISKYDAVFFRELDKKLNAKQKDHVPVNNLKLCPELVGI